MDHPEGDREIRPAGRFEWESVIRRARLAGLVTASDKVGKTGRATRGAMSELAVTAIALCWASYADPDGTKIHAGDATVAVDLGTTIKAVATVRKLLVSLGLLVHVRGRYRDRGEEYRLAFPSDLIDVVEVPTPAQHKLAARRMRDAARGKRGGSAGLPTAGVVGGPVDHPERPDTTDPGGPPDHPEWPDVPGPGWSTGPARIASGWSTGPALGGPPDPRTVQDRPPTTTDHSDRDLRTAVTAARAGPAEHEDQISELAPRDIRCTVHGPAFAGGLTDVGLPACPLCRAVAPGRARDAVAAVIAARQARRGEPYRPRHAPAAAVGPPARASPGDASDPTPDNVVPLRRREETSCTGPACYAPTDHPSGQCDRCRSQETAHAR